MQVFKNLYVFGGLLLIGLIAYYGILHTPFFSDDFAVLDRLKHKNFNAGIFLRPVSDLSIYLDFILYGRESTGYHITSVLVHIFTAFLVFVTGKALFLLARPNASNENLAAVAAVLFLIYPYHNEAVVWIVGRGVLLATTFTLLALWCYLKADGRLVYLLTGAGFYFISLFGYESPILFPLILLAIECLIKTGRINIRGLLVVSAAALLHVCIRLLYFGRLTQDGYFRTGTDGLALFQNFLRLTERSVIPPLENYRHAMLVFSVLVGTVVLLLVVNGRNLPLRRISGFGGMFVFALIPVVTVGIDTHDIEGERFLYFPSVFLIFMIVYLVNLLATLPLKRNWCFAFIGLYFIIFLARNNHSWQRAGSIVTNILADSSRYATTGTLYIIGLPDNYEGAYIFRNGFEESFRFLGRPLAVQKLAILSRLDLGRRLMDADSSLTGALQRRFRLQTDGHNLNFLADAETGQWHPLFTRDKVLIFSGRRFSRLMPGEKAKNSGQ